MRSPYLLSGFQQSPPSTLQATASPFFDPRASFLSSHQRSPRLLWAQCFQKGNVKTLTAR